MPKEDVVYLGRNPFARTDLVRRLVETRNTCAWCGSKRPSGKLFEYGAQFDNGRNSWYHGEFCSVACFRMFHGE